MNTTIANDANNGSIGKLALRLIAFALFAVFALGVVSDVAAAQASPASYQNAFNAACRKHGGTTKRVGSRIVRCTLGDGSTVTCDFNTDPPTCTSKPAALTAASVNQIVIASGAVLEVQVEPTTGPDFQVTNTRVTSRTSVAVQIDEER